MMRCCSSQSNKISSSAPSPSSTSSTSTSPSSTKHLSIHPYNDDLLIQTNDGQTKKKKISNHAVAKVFPSILCRDNTAIDVKIQGEGRSHLIVFIYSFAANVAFLFSSLCFSYFASNVVECFFFLLWFATSTTYCHCATLGIYAN